MSKAEIRYGPDQKHWTETLSPIARSQRDGRLLVSPPSRDPLILYYFKQEAITSSWYQVPSVALSQEQRANALRRDELNSQFIVTKFSILHAGWRSLFRFQTSRETRGWPCSSSRSSEPRTLIRALERVRPKVLYIYCIHNWI